MGERRWTEITVAAAREWVEPVSAALLAIGANGVAILGGTPEEAAGEWRPGRPLDDPGVRAYLPADDLLGERIGLLRRRLAEAEAEWPRVGRVVITIRPLAEADWADSWKEFYHPLEFGRIVVVPSWERFTPRAGQVMVSIDPGLAFGAGTHPTTRQCLHWLDERPPTGAAVLDVGTGCGILAIVAAKLGAKSVLARDIDGLAVEVARANAALNGLTGAVVVEEGDLLRGLNGCYDFVLANLIAPLLLEMLPDLGRVMAPGARAILAGIIAERGDEIRSAAEREGLAVAAESRDGEWLAMTVGRVREV